MRHWFLFSAGFYWSYLSSVSKWNFTCHFVCSFVDPKELHPKIEMFYKSTYMVYKRLHKMWLFPTSSRCHEFILSVYYITLSLTIRWYSPTFITSGQVFFYSYVDKFVDPKVTMLIYPKMAKLLIILLIVTL